MTHDEVVAMEDSELNSMAWTMLYTEKPWKHFANAGGIVHINGTDVSIPDYANDMSAAWTLVEKLKHPDSVWYATVSLSDHTTTYLCSVIYEYAEGSIFQVWDKSASRAITCAFIMAMESSYAS